MAESKRRYVGALIFGGIFILSSAILFTPEYFSGGPPASLTPDPIITWLPVLTAIISAIGTISAVLLAWRSDRRNAREQALKIAQLEQQLEAAKSKPAALPPKKRRKQVL
jgi:hypothetical protein